MKLKYAVKLAAIRAAYTQLGVTTQPSASVTAGIFQVQRLGASIQTLNRIVASIQEGNFVALFEMFYIRDGAGASDNIQFGFVYSRQLIDTGVSLDSVAFAAAKALADGHTVSDVINMLTGKHFSDTFSASETLAKAVSATRIDSAFLGDAHAAASSKALSDTPLLADAGSLRSQGYCDFAYFAEDYVGASRTFN
mgnify:CR=1 FL=1